MPATSVPGPCQEGRLANRRRKSMVAFIIWASAAMILGACSSPDGDSNAGGAGGPTNPGSNGSASAHSGGNGSSADASSAGANSSTIPGHTSPASLGPSRQPSGGDSLPQRTVAHPQTGFTCNQAAACTSSMNPTPMQAGVGSPHLRIDVSGCMPIDSEGHTRCEVSLISRDGQPFSLSSTTMTDPSPGSQWAADAACIDIDTLPGQSCLIEISAFGPVGQTLTAQLHARDADGIDVPGTPAMLTAVPATVPATPSESPQSPSSSPQSPSRSPESSSNSPQSSDSP